MKAFLRSDGRTLARVACICPGALAVAARAAGGVSWDFTLATLEGDRFVQASRLPGPVLVNFWGRDCPPCVAELPRLQLFAREHGTWTLLLVATDPPQDARAFLQQRGITLTALKSGQNVVPLMRAAGNRSGGLPFSVALHDGKICRFHEGELSDAVLDDMRDSCDRAAATRPAPGREAIQGGVGPRLTHEQHCLRTLQFVENSAIAVAAGPCASALLDRYEPTPAPCPIATEAAYES